MTRLRDFLPGLSLAALVWSCTPTSRPSQTPSPKLESSSVLSPEDEDCLARASSARTLPKDAPTRIEVSHILVRHLELKRPLGATRTRAQACRQALSALEALQGGAEWDAVVGQYSDAGKSNAGSLGTITSEDVTPDFAAAAFSLESNELSYVVETDRGFHVILRH